MRESSPEFARGPPGRPPARLRGALRLRPRNATLPPPPGGRPTEPRFPLLYRISRGISGGVLLALAAVPPVAAADLLVLSLAPQEEILPGPGAVVLSVSLTVLAAALIGWLQSPLLPLGRAVLSRLGPARALRALLTGLVAVPVLAVLWSGLAPGLDRVTDTDLRISLQVAFVSLCAIGGLLLGAVAAGAVEARLGDRADRPEPALAAAGLSVALAVPFVAILWTRFHQGFAAAVPVAALSLLGLCEAGALVAFGAVPLLRRAVDRILSSRPARVALLLVPLAALGLAQAAVEVDPSGAPWVAARSGVGGAVLSAVRSVADFDGDGASALLGGGDCDDGDPFLYPSAVDEPGDGIDQDCSGEDAVPGEVARLPVYALDPAEGRRLNVMMICVDAFRADRASFLGYPRRTTPNLEEMARDSWVFENAISASSTTRESIPPLFTGRYNSGIQWEKESKVRQVSPAQRLLAEVVRARGWQTLAVTDEWLKKFLPTTMRGFDVFEVAYGPGRWKEVGQQAAPYTLFRTVELMKARDPARPFLLYVHFEAAHHPYVRHEGIPTFGAQPSDLYDHELSYVDRYVGLLLEWLETEQLEDDTIVIVFGDHGEEFKEHGGQQHSRTLNVESVHVPLIIHVPGRASARVRTRVSLVDVFPTLMDLLGLRPDDPQPQGFSLLHYLEGADPYPERPIYSELMVNNEGALKYRKAVYQGRYKLMWDMSSGTTELFDVLRDPKERMPLEDTAVHDRLFGLLKDFVARGTHHP